MVLAWPAAKALAATASISFSMIPFSFELAFSLEESSATLSSLLGPSDFAFSASVLASLGVRLTSFSAASSASVNFFNSDFNPAMAFSVPAFALAKSSPFLSVSECLGTICSAKRAFSKVALASVAVSLASFSAAS